MKEKTASLLQKFTIIVDLFFISFIFIYPLVLVIFFEFSLKNLQLGFVALLSVWIICKVFYSNLNIKKVSLFDLGVLCLLFYVLWHFSFFSKTSFLFFGLWVYLGYLLIFYLFRWVLDLEDKSKYMLHFILLLIVCISVLQSIIGLLQYFDVIQVKNLHFKLLGSFNTPNFLGVFIGFGFIILLWFMFVLRVQKRLYLLIIILGLILFGILIVLSNSRGSWLAILASLLVLLITSNKSKLFIKNVSIVKIFLSVILIGILLFFTGKYLYALKPESVNGRAFTTKITLQEIAKQPLLGHGLFSFAGEYNMAKADYFGVKARPWEEVKVGTYVFTAFNDYLLMAFELGVLVLLILLSLIGFVIIKSKSTPETRIGLALFISLCVFALFNSPLNSVYIMCVGLFGLAVVIKFGGLQGFVFNPPLYYRNTLKVLVFIMGCLGIFAISNKIINEKKFKDYSLRETGASIEELIFLAKVAEDNFFSGYVLGQKLYEGGNQKEGVKSMELAFQKSSAPRIGKRLASVYLQEGNYKRAEEILRFNIDVEPYRYEPRMDLLKLLSRCNRYAELVSLSHDIADLPVKIPSMDIDNYKNLALHNIKVYSKYASLNPVLKGSISNGKLMKSKILKKTLPYKVYLPPINLIVKKLPVIYINDGFNYINVGGMHKILDSLIINNVIEPVIAVFLEPRDKKNSRINIRQELFLCNPLFEEFFTKEFIPVIENLYPVSHYRNDRTILGVSFGGLAAAYLANGSPSTFKNIAMQSPAFHPCKDIYKSYYVKPKRDFNIYISYGTGEDTEEQDLPFIHILRKKGYSLKVEPFEEGNHNWELWKEQLDDILIYFYQKH